MTSLSPPDRAWTSAVVRDREAEVLAEVRSLSTDGLRRWLERRVAASRVLHERTCWNLNPAANVLDPRAEALLAAGASTRPSLGHAGEKYETGLEELEQVEVVAAALARDVFGVRHAEVRLPSGATSNLAAFLALAPPGSTIIAPPATIGGHVTHHAAGAAGVAGFVTVPAPVDAGRHTVDVDALATLAREVRPAIITLGTSCNLLEHPVSRVREIADEVGAKVVFDAAHVAGLIAGGAWANPVHQGAHVASMSTYKSLAGPPGGLLLTDDDAIAERLDAIAYPGFTANFDVGRVAALAATLAGWRSSGAAYATAMVAVGAAFAAALADEGVPVWSTDEGHTRSHALVVDARGLGGGEALAHRLRRANLLASAIGLPVEDEGPGAPGLRMGVNELVRFGVGVADDGIAELATLVARAVHDDPAAVAHAVTSHRARFQTLHHLDAPPA